MVSLENMAANRMWCGFEKQDKKNKKKSSFESVLKNEVSIIIPAYNEEKNIGRVLEAFAKNEVNNLVREVIVVNDGSTDNTAKKVLTYRFVRLISYKKNRGKAYALWRGVRAARGKIILFLDADLIGLRGEHILQLVRPIIRERAELVLGLLDKKMLKTTNLASIITPSLTGQRAIKKELLNKLNLKSVSRLGYAIDLIIMDFVRAAGGRIRKIYLTGLTQVVKEKKLDLSKSIEQRMRMYKEITKYIFLYKKF